MANVTITIKGVQLTRLLLNRLEEEAVTFGRLRGLIGTNVHYARYQEFGTRYMAGRFYLTRALDVLLPMIGTTIAPALLQGPAAVRKAMQTLLFRGLAQAVVNAPARTGQLRGSLHTRLESR